MKHLKDLKKKLCTIEGSWLGHLSIDDQVYWDISQEVPSRQIPLIEEEE